MENKKKYIIKLYKQGYSCRLIAEKMGYSCHKQIGRILRNNNIYVRKGSQALKSRYRMTPKPKTAIYKCIKCGDNRHRKSKLFCRDCYLSVDYSKKKSPSWKGGKPRCSKCNNKLSQYNIKTQLCRKCHDKISGPQHWNWQGGSKQRPINTKKYKQWRQKVFQRDNYTCQKCKQHGDKLNAHHIIPWSKNEYFRYALCNGITLCLTCHKLEHGWNISKGQ